MDQTCSNNCAFVSKYNVFDQMCILIIVAVAVLGHWNISLKAEWAAGLEFILVVFWHY